MADKEIKNAAKAQQVEETYEPAEIAANAPRLFGYSVDLATAALSLKVEERYTLADAKRIIKDFAEKRV